MTDGREIRNQDLVLRVDLSIDPALFNLAAYDAFLDALCDGREYQVNAIKTTLAYWLGGKYENLRELARGNYAGSQILQERYREFPRMERSLQLPDQLACSLDLATGTGKSYVIYGLAAVMLAQGAVDRVLVLTPSRTIESGLQSKFRDLAGDTTLRELLPPDAKVLTPDIINGTESLVAGTICVENFHQTLQHVESSIRASLTEGRGARTLVINDEVHHLYSPPGTELRRWKEFVADPALGFRYVAGLSGTCYTDNEYFADVIARYSLRQGIEDGYLKTIDYVAEDTSTTDDERMQKIYATHAENKTVHYRRIKPLTVLVTKDIAACRRLHDEWVRFLAETEGLSIEDAGAKVLIVTSAAEHAANIRLLEAVDDAENPVEFVTSVSMLTEGWDVHNVAQIVPHEKRAFDSKLLIAQVLGRGVRVPDAYRGHRPVVSVFNHAAWSRSIKGLVDEVLEIEKRIASYPVIKTPSYDFDLHTVEYDREQEVEEVVVPPTVVGGSIPLVSQVAEAEQTTTYVRATSGASRERRTLVRYRMYTIQQVVSHIQEKISAIDLEEGTHYADEYDAARLTALIKTSLALVGETQDRVSEENRQRLQAALGSIHGQTGRVVRYSSAAGPLSAFSTSTRARTTAALSALRRGDDTVFYDTNSLPLSDPETAAVLQEALDDETLPRSALEAVANSFLFKTPVNVAITSHKPERTFVRYLLREENAVAVTGWIKSPDRDFYAIEYGYKRGSRIRRGGFNPDFFVRTETATYVCEIKDDSERQDVSQENRAKYLAARDHFALVNTRQADTDYRFHFLTPADYDAFFTFLRADNAAYVSRIDEALARPEDS